MKKKRHKKEANGSDDGIEKDYDRARRNRGELDWVRGRGDDNLKDSGELVLRGCPTYRRGLEAGGNKFLRT